MTWLQVSNPYYRTAYALVFKQGMALTALTRWAICASRASASVSWRDSSREQHGSQRSHGQCEAYPLVIDTRVDSSAAAMIHDLATNEIDVGILWGPVACYYARRMNPTGTVVLLVQGDDRSSPRLSHRHGRAVLRPGMETSTQSHHSRDPACH